MASIQYPCDQPSCPNRWHRTPTCPNTTSGSSQWGRMGSVGPVSLVGGGTGGSAAGRQHPEYPGLVAVLAASPLLLLAWRLVLVLVIDSHPDRRELWMLAAAGTAVLLPAAIAGWCWRWCWAVRVDGYSRCRQPRKGIGARCGVRTHRGTTVYDWAGLLAAAVAVINFVAALNALG